MDPITAAQRRLCDWAREMGYLHENKLAPNPSQLISACNTPTRRQLIDVLIQTIKDRRKIEKDPFDDSEEMKQIKLINDLRNEVIASDAEIDSLQKRIKMRFSKLISIERETQDLEIKRALIQRVQARNLVMSGNYRKLGKAIEKCCCCPEVKTDEVEQWLHKSTEEITERVNDPAVVDLVTTKIATDAMGYHKLFVCLGNQQRHMLEIVKMASSSTSQDFHCFLRRELSTTETSWDWLLAKNKVDCIVVDAGAVLIRGNLLRSSSISKRSPNVEEILSRANTLITSIYKDIDDLPIVADKEFEKLDVQLMAYAQRQEILKKNLHCLREHYSSSLANIKRARCTQEDQVRNLTDFLQTETPKWRLVVERHKHLKRKHTEGIWQKSLQSLRFSNNTENSTPEINQSMIPMVANMRRTEPDYFQELRFLVRDLQEQENIEYKSRRGKKVWRQLHNALERLSDLPNKIDQVRDILNICKEQPFGEMIPSTHTVDGMTLKEWRFQFSLSSSTMRRGDFSFSVYSADS